MSALRRHARKLRCQRISLFKKADKIEDCEVQPLLQYGKRYYIYRSHPDNEWQNLHIGLREVTMKVKMLPSAVIHTKKAVCPRKESNNIGSVEKMSSLEYRNPRQQASPELMQERDEGIFATMVVFQKQRMVQQSRGSGQHGSLWQWCMFACEGQNH